VFWEYHGGGAVLLAVPLTFLSLYLQLYYFKIADKSAVNTLYMKKGMGYVVLAGFLAAAALCVVFLSGLDRPMTLAQQQLEGVEYLGLTYKTVAVILPAIAFLVFFSSLNTKVRLGVFILSLVISAYASFMFLSKAPLMPYIVFTTLLYLQKRKSNQALFFVLALIITVLYMIYVGREEDMAISDIIRAAIFRVPLWVELDKVLTWLLEGESNPAWLFNMRMAPEFITEKVFGYDSRYIGIAPSYMGFFIALYGVLGIVISLVFIPLFAVFIKSVSGDSVLERFLYFLWSLELMSFFIDGNPLFYISTTGGAMFWGLVVLSVYSLLHRNVRANIKLAR
jgi:hypothetical protein